MRMRTGSPWIVIRFTAEGWHHWPGASSRRTYLANVHRHLFHVEVWLPVEHEEREVEFHDLLEFCRESFGSGDFGTASCETLATRLGKEIARRFGRACEVLVMEDGEAGAMVTVELPPPPQ